MSFLTGVLLLAIVTALACSLPGVFVVLRRDSMLVDAISHAILPGIVVGFLITQDLRSPVLIAGAALAGLVVVLGSEYLTRSGLLTGDAPQGLIFPALFSLGVILVSMNFANVHLDVHAVLVGDLNLAAFDQLVLGGVAWGPTYLYVMLGVLILNAVYLTWQYRRLKVTTFDPEFAAILGARTGWINTGFMFLVSVTVTAAFNAAGAILVIALMIVPPATAYLLTSQLGQMIRLTLLITVVGAWGGFWAAYALNAATSAGMGVFYGLLFAAVLGWVRSREGLRRRRARAIG